MQRRIFGWLMNWKGFGRNRPWCNRGSILEFAWTDRGKSKEISARIISGPVEIRTEDLPNTCPECCSYANPVGRNINSVKNAWQNVSGIKGNREEPKLANRDWKVAAPVKKTEINDRGNPLRWPRNTLYPQKLVLLRQQAAVARSA
jgi:hypothetical protein